MSSLRKITTNLNNIMYSKKTMIYRTPIYHKPRFSTGKSFLPNISPKFFFEKFDFISDNLGF